jgi:hypothetical protein
MSCISYYHLGCFGTIYFGRPHFAGRGALSTDHSYTHVTPPSYSLSTLTPCSRSFQNTPPCHLRKTRSKDPNSYTIQQNISAPPSFLTYFILPLDRQPFLSTSTPSDIYYPFIYLRNYILSIHVPGHVEYRLNMSGLILPSYFHSFHIYTNTFSA